MTDSTEQVTMDDLKDDIERLRKNIQALKEMKNEIEELDRWRDRVLGRKR